MGAKFGKRRYVFQIFGQEEKLLPRAQSGRKNLASLLTLSGLHDFRFFDLLGGVVDPSRNRMSRNHPESQVRN